MHHLNPTYRIFFNFTKSCVLLSCSSNVDNIKKNSPCRFLIIPPKVVVKGVAMVTYCVTKMVTTCSPIVGQFFDTMLVASSDMEWL